MQVSAPLCVRPLALTGTKHLPGFQIKNETLGFRTVIPGLFLVTVVH